MQNEITNGFQLSPQQEHLWQLQQSHDEGWPYYAKCIVLIDGDLNRDALKNAIDLVVNRHEILRTGFVSLAGMATPLQVASEETAFAFDEHDLGKLDPTEQQERIEKLFKSAGQKTPELERGPLLHVSLVTLSPKKYELILVLPALCTDRIGLQHLVSQISEAYAASLKNEKLPELSLQYVDIAEWQNELLKSEDTKAGREYWEKDDFAAAYRIRLPFEKRVLETQPFKPQTIRRTINKETLGEIKTLAKQHGTSEQCTLLACWLILLHRFGTDREMVVGMASDGRNHEELEGAVGLISRYLPLKCQMGTELTFGELLGRVHKTTHSHEKRQQYFSFPKNMIAEENQHAVPFIPYCFDFSTRPIPYFADSISFSIVDQYSCIDSFKVKLSCLSENDHLTMKFYFDASYFDSDNIKRLSTQFLTLLQSVIDNPGALIETLDMIGAAEKRKIIHEYNDTNHEYPKGQCIHRLFERQVEKYPQEIALVHEQQSLSYAELNTRANQLAHHLCKLGVGPGSLVGVFLERSAETIVAFLGVLKSGAAYIPFHFGQPAERLSYMLADADASLLLTQRDFLDSIAGTNINVLCLDAVRDRVAQESEDNLDSEPEIKDLAYVIFTSGSTGHPKGVAIEHRQLSNYVYGIMERLDIPRGAHFATLSSFTADLCNTSIYPSLCSGGCLHVLSYDRATDPIAASQYFEHHPIDYLKITPSHLKALMQAPDPERVLPHKWLILGGEVCSWELAENIKTLAPNCHIMNHYGPTETTVGVTTYNCDNVEPPYATKTVPIGRPISNTRIYILDSTGKPVPIWAVGEIHVGGDSVARGYLNHSELTEENFISSPFNGNREDRLYKTGDLGRFLPDGNIEFVGRIDDQLKFRGYRIELGEVQTTIESHPDVETAAVVGQQSKHDAEEMRVIAYIVTDKARDAFLNTLRSFLQEKLPAYMLPSTYIVLDSLPITKNGKLDRQALPDPDSIIDDTTDTYVAPQTESEERLAEIWSNVLGVKKVGMRDDFFALGGDSIHSIQIIAQARQAGLRLTPRQIFEHPTIMELAKLAGKIATRVSEDGLVTGPVPLTPIQHWFFEQNLPDPHHYNMANLLEVRQKPDLALLEKAVNQLVIHHDALRLRHTKGATGWMQINAGTGESVYVERRDLSSVPDREKSIVLLSAASELQAGLSLSKGPLLRAAFFDYGANNPGKLLVVIHHLAVDGVSWRILLEDLDNTYQQLQRGESVQLPQKTCSFKRWAEGLKQYAESPELQREQAYWLDERRGQVKRLPLDFQESYTVNTVATTKRLSVSLDAEQTRLLLQEVPKVYRTQINDVLLTALAQVFSKWTGEQFLLVDMEGHGREEIREDLNVSRTVGWFTTRFPILIGLDKHVGPAENMKAVKEQLHQIPNYGIGYGVLRYLGNDAEISNKLRKLPQPEVSFNYMGQFDNILSTASLFGLTEEDTGQGCSLQATRRYLLKIDGGVINGRLNFVWAYSERIHKEDTITGLAQDFKAAIRQLIDHCLSTGGAGYVASDFPRAKISQKDLETILDELS